MLFLLWTADFILGHQQKSVRSTANILNRYPATMCNLSLCSVSMWVSEWKCRRKQQPLSWCGRPHCCRPDGCGSQRLPSFPQILTQCIWWFGGLFSQFSSFAKCIFHNLWIIVFHDSVLWLALACVAPIASAMNEEDKWSNLKQGLNLNR